MLFMNRVAESLTGWPEGEVAGKPIANVFRIVNDSTRQPLQNPVTEELATGAFNGLSNHIVLIARDETEWALDDGAAPVRDASGTVLGAVLVTEPCERRTPGHATQIIASSSSSGPNGHTRRAFSPIRAYSSWLRKVMREELL